MAVFFIMMLLVYLAGNIYVYVRGLQTVHHFPLWSKWLYSIVYWSIALSFMFVFVLRNAGISISLSHILFEMGTGWLVFTLYMVLLLGGFDLLRLFVRSLPNGFLPALLFTICILTYGYIRYQYPSVKVINLAFNKTLADSDASIKVVAISDVHLGLGTVKSKLKKYVDLINRQEPDLILISGDLIDNSIVPVENQQMHEELSQLNARLGVYMANGNHEYISGIKDCMRFLARTPIHVLRDSVVTLPNGIQLIGRDDRSVRSRKAIAQLTQDINTDRPFIVLDHQPVELGPAVEAGADLLICGHTHNGQVWPLNLVTKRMFEISYGYEKREQTHIYVTSGLSLWGPP
ncbi:MAG: metallophosphoesterase, partial [Tannerella sp.]|nr:metallophosphoesterase [Tannerella sp.]